MAGDWIKMRPSLLTSPKVNGIARELESSADVTRALSTGYSGDMSEIVTRNVMRYVTVTSLLCVWGAANEHTSAGVFVNADLSDIDDIAGIPGFGAAMVSVGWAIFDEESMTVTLPNFNEYNNSARERSSAGAERQRRYREKKASSRDAASDVTRDVTVTEREEKRREEKKEQKAIVRQAARFAEFYAEYPVKKGKAQAEAKWKARGLDAIADRIIADVKDRKARDRQWLDGYAPHASTYVNGRGWEDEIETRQTNGSASSSGYVPLPGEF